MTIIHLPRATTVIVLPAGTAPLRFLGWTRRPASPTPTKE